MSKPRLTELLERELTPYVGARAEFIAGRMTPGVGDFLIKLIDEAIHKHLNSPPAADTWSPTA